MKKRLEGWGCTKLTGSANTLSAKHGCKRGHEGTRHISPSGHVLKVRKSTAIADLPFDGFTT